GGKGRRGGGGGPPRGCPPRLLEWPRYSHPRQRSRQCRLCLGPGRGPAACWKAAREHGRRSLSGHPRPQGCRASPLFPCSFPAVSPRSVETAPRAEQSPMFVHLLARPQAPLGKAGRLPHLKLRAQADKSDMGSNAGVGAKRFRKHDASLLVDREDVHIAVERDRELVALVRIIRKAVEKPVD